MRPPRRPRRIDDSWTCCRTGIQARCVEALPPSGPGGDEFIRGDPNNDGGVNIADAISLFGTPGPTFYQ